MQLSKNYIQLNFELYFFSTSEGGRKSAISSSVVYRAPVLFGLKDVSKMEVIENHCSRSLFRNQSFKSEMIDGEFSFKKQFVQPGEKATGVVELHYSNNLVEEFINKHYPVLVVEYNIVAWGHLSRL